LYNRYLLTRVHNTSRELIVVTALKEKGISGSSTVEAFSSGIDELKPASN
jgi:hypothetical protein